MASIPDHTKNGVWVCIVEPLVMSYGRRQRESGEETLQSLARPSRWRNDRPVGDQCVVRHVGAHAACIIATAWGKPTIAVAHCGLGLLGLGVSKQYQAHANTLN